MHNHDIELIMALAEGSLDPSAATAARTEIEACPECSHDLMLQTEAWNALQTLPEVRLTELESARLRRNVRDELGLVRPTAHEQPQQQRRRLPLAALGTAAAVLVAIVIAGPAMDLIGGGADDAADTTEAVALDTTSAPAAIEQAPADDFGNGVAEAATTAAPLSTTAAPAPTTTTVVPPDDTRLYAYYLQSPDLDSLLGQVEETGFDAEAARSRLLRNPDAGSILEESIDDSETCIAVTTSSEENLIEGFQVARGQLDGRDVIYVVYLAEDLAESVLIAHAADNCEELLRAGG